MSANLTLEINFLELVKSLFTSNNKLSVEHSDKFFRIFDGILLKGRGFLLLIEFISFDTFVFATSLKLNKF